MINIKSAHIKNFYSIKDITLRVSKGVFSVTGDNRDEFESNGSGKTTILLAIQQCFYNRNVKMGTSKLDTVFNNITNKPYTIAVVFVKDSSTYTITNSREANKIIIEKDGVDISVKGIPAQLKQVQTILNCDYNTFVGLTYITQNASVDIIEDASKSSLVKNFFGLGAMDVIGKNLKIKLRALKASASASLTLITSIQNSIDKLSVEEIPDYTNELNTLNLLKLDVDKDEFERDSYIRVVEREIDTYEAALDKEKALYIETTSIISNIKEKLSVIADGKCITCGADTEESVTDKLHDDLSTQKEFLACIKEAGNDLRALIKAKEDEVFSTQEFYVERLLRKKSDIARLTNLILEANAKKEAMTSIANSKESLETSLREETGRRTEAVKQITFLTHIVSVIDDGSVVGDYLKLFSKVFDTKIAEYSDIININDYKIYSENHKGGLKFNVYNGDKSVDTNQLSTGELARVKLIIIVSIVDTVGMLTNGGFNILSFDEFFGVVDTSFIDDIRNLFSFFKDNKDMSIFCVTHHGELSDITFDGSIKIIKENGISRMENIDA